MAEIQTKPNAANVDAFIAGVDDPVRQADARTLTALMSRVTAEPAVMWGPAIIGFGRRGYDLAGGKRGEMLRVGFSPRKANLALYLSKGFDGADDLLARIGKIKPSKGCLHVNRLSDVDQALMEELVAKAWTHTTADAL